MKTRTSKPKNNKYYIRKVNGGYNGAVQGKPVISGANVLCNCVGYANGRFGEIQGLGYIKYQLVCNAENFIAKAKSYGLKISKTPTLGGIMVWQKGKTLNDSDGAGHVAVVEEIINDNKIVTSESGYNSFSFKTITRTNSNGNWGQANSYKFLGCIVNPAVKTTTTDPLSKYTDEQLAEKVIKGEFGNGDARKKALGSRYSAVQKIVDKKLSASASKAVYYTVKKGDTLSEIAARYGVDWHDVAKLNNLKNANMLHIGQKIRIK